MDEKGGDELEVDVCTTWLDLIEFECSFKSAMRIKIRKNKINSNPSHRTIKIKSSLNFNKWIRSNLIP